VKTTLLDALRRTKRQSAQATARTLPGRMPRHVRRVHSSSRPGRMAQGRRGSVCSSSLAVRSHPERP
jgi:hypothetical protein